MYALVPEGFSTKFLVLQFFELRSPGPLIQQWAQGGFETLDLFVFQIPAKVHVNRLFFVDKRWQSSPDFGFFPFLKIFFLSPSLLMEF